MHTNSTKRMRSVGTGAVLALALLGTACDTEPPPPPPHLAVTSTADLPDANPGDGICEATAGTGDCTVRAAIGEGNALGRADIAVPAGSHLTDGTVSVTGRIRITGPSTATLLGIAPDAEVFEMSDTRYEVAAGGSLLVTGTRLSGIQVRVASGGSFAGIRTSMSGLGGLLYQSSPGAALTVEAGGTAILQTSIVGSMGSPSITNRGAVLVDQSTIGGYAHTPLGYGAGPPMETTGDGTTQVRGSWLAGTGCTGTMPVSMGYNAAVGTSCGLTGPTDLQNAPANTASVGSSISPSGALVDAIPLGEAMCGTVTSDIEGIERPRDGNGDGVAACDIGAREL